MIKECEGRLEDIVAQSCPWFPVFLCENVEVGRRTFVGKLRRKKNREALKIVEKLRVVDFL